MTTSFYDIPILLIGFNRPHLLSESLKHIRGINPRKLYIAIDGPRNDNPNDVILVHKVISIVKEYDGCGVKEFLINSENKGAEKTISEAISHVFTKEDKLVIIEDDIIASSSFFLFAKKMLEMYQDNHNISIVSGGNFTPLPYDIGEDYHFSKYGHTGCGWATWKRSWEDFDLYTSINDKYLNKKYLSSIIGNNYESKYFLRLFKKIKSLGKGNSPWDMIRVYIHFKNNMLSIVPRHNLTSNIGVYGLHDYGITKDHYREYKQDFVVSKHPKTLSCNRIYDKYHYEKYLAKQYNFFNRLKNYFIRKMRKIAHHKANKFKKHV